MKSTFAHDIVSRIDGGYADETEGEARSYIGASVVGNDCNAYLQFSLRGFDNDPPDPRLKRIFRDGHRIEDAVVKDLRKAKLNVIENDPMTGKQHRREWLGGHVVCNADGLISDPAEGDAVLEIKSMNDASWKKFQKSGVKISHRHYYRQMQMLMAMFRIETSFFIAYNKNNSEYWAEVVPFDQSEWDWLYTRMQYVIDGGGNRIAEEPTDWRCKGCFKRSVCWDTPDVKPNCRLCKHSAPKSSGEWHCALRDSPCKDPCDQFDVYRPTKKE